MSCSRCTELENQIEFLQQYCWMLSQLGTRSSELRRVTLLERVADAARNIEVRIDNDYSLQSDSRVSIQAVFDALAALDAAKDEVQP